MKKISIEALTLIFVIILIVGVIWSKVIRTEGYRVKPALDYCFRSNDLRSCAANCGATPWSVVPPCWIGQVDQGNGRIGDDVMSGYAYYSAY